MNVHNCKWILVFFMLWLPAQGAIAAILSVCVQENFNRYDDKSVITIDSHHHEGCHKETSDNNNHLLANLPCNDTTCDAYSQTLILPDYIVAASANNNTNMPIFHFGFLSFIPEQPQHPPLIVSF